MAVTTIELDDDEVVLAAGAFMFCAGLASTNEAHQKRLTDLAAKFIARGAMATMRERVDALGQ